LGPFFFFFESFEFVFFSSISSSHLISHFLEKKHQPAYTNNDFLGYCEVVPDC